MSLKLKNLVGEDKFEIDPTPNNQFYKYVGWNPETAVKERTIEEFNILSSLLSQLSSVFVEMARKDYFSSQERTEMTHVIPWMLGCTRALNT